MIFVEMKIPGYENRFFLMDELESVQKILSQLSLLLGQAGLTCSADGGLKLAGAVCLIDDLTGLRLHAHSSLQEQGIVSGCRLRLELTEGFQDAPAKKRTEGSDVSIQ